MFKNYFKTAWRNIIRTIGYSTLNVVGLAIGMAVALLIGLWVYNQYSYDKFLPEYQSAYRVQRNYDSNGDTLTFRSTSLKILVVIQFICSIALIISTVIIYQQVNYAKGRPTGYDLNRLMSTNMNDDLVKNYTAIKNELIQKNIVESVTAASSPSTDIWWHSDVEQWPGKHAGETIEMGTIMVSDDYFKTLGMELKSGREFSSAADTTNVIFNEAAIKRMRIKEPLNQIVNWQEHQLRIIAIAKDALMLTPFASADPTMFLYNPKNVSVMD